jgi:hypothetical protein
MPPPPPPRNLNPNYQDQSATVYVGHICNKISDDSVRELLELCGDISKWNRQTDPLSGKPAHFGFCEFKRLEGAWRATEMLDGRQLGSKSLVIKADAKIQDRIQNFEQYQRVNHSNEDRIRATIGAVCTTVNTQWREAAMLNDAEVHDISPPPEPSVVIPSADFLKAFAKFDAYFAREMSRDREDGERELAREIERKEKLIAQDGVDGFKVRSNFTASDRRREIEFDERDRLDDDQGQGIATKTDVPVEFKITSSIPPSSSGDEIFLAAIRQLPVRISDIEKFHLSYPIGDATQKRLMDWLPSKIQRMRIRASFAEAAMLATQVLSWVVVERCTVTELVFRLSGNESLMESFCVRVFQLIIFDQILAREVR